MTSLVDKPQTSSFQIGSWTEVCHEKLHAPHVVLLASVGKPSSSAPLAGLRFQLGLTSAGRQFRDALALPWFSEQRFVIPFWVLLWFEHRRQVPLTRERGGHWTVDKQPDRRLLLSLADIRVTLSSGEDGLG